MGYQGSDQTVRRFIASWRWTDPPLPTGTPRFQPYSPRHVAWMFMLQRDALSKEEADYLEHLRTDEQIADLSDLAQTFCRMVRDRDVACLDICWEQQRPARSVSCTALLRTSSRITLRFAQPSRFPGATARRKGTSRD